MRSAAPRTEGSSEYFPKDLGIGEEKMIRARRTLVGRSPHTHSLPKVSIGLTLSGGGVRSATFNLGVLQALAEAHALRAVDYLSTVSGGGYIGAFLGRFYTRFLNRPAGAVDIIEERLSDSRSPEVSWLRHSGQYLSPGGGGHRM